jgi:hypothetical protein
MGITISVRVGMSKLLRYPLLRFALGYLSKVRRRIRRHSKPRLRPLPEETQHQTADISLAKVLRLNDEADKSTLPDTTDTPRYALRLLSEHPRYEVLQLIAYKLHYIDIINLSLVSRRIHRLIFPESKLVERSELLRSRTCYGNSKSQCWGCNIQICTVSYFRRV